MGSLLEETLLVSKKHRIFRMIRELFFYGDITKAQFDKYMGMARNNDPEMVNLVDIIVKEEMKEVEKRWYYPKKDED